MEAVLSWWMTLAANPVLGGAVPVVTAPNSEAERKQPSMPCIPDNRGRRERC